jgi:feruloyl-CoA synthase
MTTSKLDLRTAPFRDARYAPRNLQIERRAGGEIVLSNPTTFSERFQTATAALAHWAQAAPQRVWLAERSGEGWRTLTYAEGWQRVQTLAGGLREAGIIGSRPLMILSNNGVDHALLRYAAMSQGMPVATVSPQYGLPGANLARLTHACEVLRPAAVYTEDAVLFGEGLSAPALAGLPVIALRNERRGDIPLERLYGSARATATAQPADHAIYLLTSGSTGLPKAVISTHQMISVNAAQIEACFDDPEPPVMVHSAPWSHVLGASSILHMVLHRGGALYIDWGQPTASRFGETIRNLREISPTYQQMVPAGWMLMAAELEKDQVLARRFFDRLRLMQYGGATLSQATADRIEKVAIKTIGERISFGSGYGATEAGTVCNVHWLNDRTGMIGLPLPGTSVRLVPEFGKLGFRVKGPQVSPGYLGRPDLSERAFDEEGFHILGDAARFADPASPDQGMIFDGRISENFKLASGSFIGVSELRVGAVGAIGGAVTDAVVCGEGEAAVGLLLYPNPTLPRHEIEAAVREGLTRFNAEAKGGGPPIARALVLPSPPDPAKGEITDKGYISQVIARGLRADAVQRLYLDPVAADVMQF